MSIFNEIGPWLEKAVAEVQTIEAKAASDLTQAEAVIAQHAPVLAKSVDGFLTVAETIAGDLDPDAGKAVDGLKALFDGLVAIVEKAFPIEGAEIVLPTESIVKDGGAS